ncbi:MAG: UDP-glucose/GDP-mannose dehydrogenase family protein [Thermoproteota archaeon]
MKIGIIGLGFVGLSFASVLGSKGYSVIGADTDAKKISMIKNGKTPFYEPKLTETLKEALKGGLYVTTDISPVVNECELIFITVGTPQQKNGSIDLTMIKSVSEKMGKLLAKTTNKPTIVVKSTVLPETTIKVVLPILEKKSKKKVGRDFGLVTNPEFLRETNAIHDTINPHVVVIGSFDDRYAQKVEKFYLSFHKNVPIVRTNHQTAEMIKYANNSFLATKISFINQIAKICEAVPGANVDDVAKTIGLDPRIGPLFLNAGPGYGGSCLPKDVKAIINFSLQTGVKSPLLNAVELINNEQLEGMISVIKKKLGSLKGKRVTILGLAFKPDTDDIRDSVSIKLIELLLKNKTDIIVHDPKAIENTRTIFGQKIRYAHSLNDALKGSYCAILMTAWKQYTSINNNNLKFMKKPIIIDSRRVLTKKNLDADYYALGIGQ